PCQNAWINAVRQPQTMPARMATGIENSVTPARAPTNAAVTQRDCLRWKEASRKLIKSAGSIKPNAASTAGYPCSKPLPENAPITVPNTHDDHERKAMPIIQFSLQRRLLRTSFAVAAAKTSSVRPHAH